MRIIYQKEQKVFAYISNEKLYLFHKFLYLVLGIPLPHQQEPFHMLIKSQHTYAQIQISYPKIEQLHKHVGLRLHQSKPKRVEKYHIPFPKKFQDCLKLNVEKENLSSLYLRKRSNWSTHGFICYFNKSHCNFFNTHLF